jgi:hypothetical protein
MKFKPAPKVSFYSRDQAIMILKVLNTYLVKNQRSGDVNYTTAKFYSINYRQLLNFSQLLLAAFKIIKPHLLSFPSYMLGKLTPVTLILDFLENGLQRILMGPFTDIVLNGNAIPFLEHGFNEC